MSSDLPAIRLRHLSKKYRIYDRPSARLREMLWPGRRRHREFWALRDISLEVRRGATLGIIGANGSGKSTLLQIIAGILLHTEGDLWVSGKVAPLLELGAGFNPEFTGRENVYLNGAVLGLTKAEIDDRFESIKRFAEIGDFLEQPVKTYSSGMFMRLAFAVAIHVDPDILLVDEALAVGDMVFQHRCIHRIGQLRDAGKTILFVSHDLQAVVKFCDDAVLLDGGRLLASGKPDLVVQKYHALILERERSSKQFVADALPDAAAEDASIQPVTTIPNIDHRFGNGQAEVLGILLLGPDGSVTASLRAGEQARIRVSAKFKAEVASPIVGFTLRDRLGVEITSSNTAYEGIRLPPARDGDVMTVDFHISVPEIRPGSYSLSPAVAGGSVWVHDIADWIDNAYVFDIENTGLVYGMLKINSKPQFHVQNG